MRRALATLLALTLSVPLALLLTEPAEAAGTPLDGFVDLVVDDAHGHVFVSEGPHGVLVTDLAGDHAQALAGVSTGYGMVLSADADTLYVATGDAIASVNLATLAVTSTSVVNVWPGAAPCAQKLVLSAGLLWVNGWCDNQLRAFDPATGTLTGPYAVRADFMASSPALPDRLFTLSDDFSIDAYTVTGGATPTLTASDQAWYVGDNAEDFAVSPDGSQALAAGFSPNEAVVFDTTTLTRQKGYAPIKAEGPVAVAARADGMVAAGVNPYESKDPDIYFYRAGSRKVTKSVNLGRRQKLLRGGLAFGATNVYAVAKKGSHYALFVVSPLPDPGLTVKAARGTIRAGHKATITASLGVRHHRPVSIYAAVGDKVRKLVDSGKVSADGTFTVKKKLKRTTTFTAEYTGDANHSPATATVRVNVKAKVSGRLAGSYSTQGKWKLFHASDEVTIKAKVKPAHAGDCLRLEFQLTRGHKHFVGSIACATLNKHSATYAYVNPSSVKVGDDIRLRAVWEGDGDNAKAKGPWRYARVTK